MKNNKLITIITLIAFTTIITLITGLYFFNTNARAESSNILTLITPPTNLTVGSTFTVSVNVTNLEPNQVPQAGLQYDARKLEYVNLIPGDAGDVFKEDLSSEGNNQRIVIKGVAGSTGNHELARISFRIKDFSQEVNANGKGEVQMCTLIDPAQSNSATTPTTIPSTSSPILSPSPSSSYEGTPVAGDFDEIEENRLFEKINASRVVQGNTGADSDFTSMNLSALTYNSSLHQAARKLAVAMSQNDAFEKCLTDTSDSTEYTSLDPSSPYFWKKDPNGQWFDRNGEPYLHTDLDGGNLNDRLTEFGYPPTHSNVVEGVICRTFTSPRFILPKWWIRSPQYADLAIGKVNNSKGFVIVMIFGKPD